MTPIHRIAMFLCFLLVCAGTSQASARSLDPSPLDFGLVSATTWLEVSGVQTLPPLQGTILGAAGVEASPEVLSDAWRRSRNRSRYGWIGMGLGIGFGLSCFTSAYGLFISPVLGSTGAVFFISGGIAAAVAGATARRPLGGRAIAGLVVPGWILFGTGVVTGASSIYAVTYYIFSEENQGLAFGLVAGSITTSALAIVLFNIEAAKHREALVTAGAVTEGPVRQRPRVAGVTPWMDGESGGLAVVGYW